MITDLVNFSDTAPLLAVDQRHPWLRYQIQEYIEGIMHSYEQRLGIDEAGSGSEVEDGVFWRRAAGVRDSCLEETIWDLSTFGPRLGGVRRRITWRHFILVLGLHTEQEMVEAGDFLGLSPSYVLIRDPVRRLCHKMIAYSISSRGQAPEKACGGEEEQGQAVRGHFIGRLAMHFGLVSDEGLRGPQAAAAGAHKADEAGQAAEEVAQEIPAPA
ncbi:hypothetical protein Tco_0164746 [Tanacetum coccineum]